MRFLLACLLGAASWAQTPYEAEIRDWRQEHETRLKADDGWLSVAGLWWLREGQNVLGEDEALRRLGVFEFQSGKAVFRAAPGARVTAGGKPVSVIEMQADVPGPPTLLASGDLTLLLIRRGDRFGIRLKDKNSELRKEFRGLRWFPPQESYRVSARWVAFPAPRPLPIVNILGITEPQPSPGYAVFTLEGREHRLQPVLEGSRLFFIFRDRTSGKDTYPAGRFLYAEPDGDRVLLDFNKAENPPCAFNPYTTCPLPPRQNQLPIAIEAGEMTYLPAETVERQIRPVAGSRFELQVRKTGLMRGKVHLFVFERYRGTLLYDAQKPENSRVRLTIEAASAVLKDTWLSAADFRKVQQYALETMLAAGKHPHLEFASTVLRAEGNGRYQLQGLLTIRGIAKLVTVLLSTREDGGALTVTGTAQVKMTDYGLKPPSAVLGAVGTRDEMDVSFEIKAQ